MNKQMWYEQTRPQISNADIWGCSGRLLAEVRRRVLAIASGAVLLRYIFTIM